MHTITSHFLDIKVAIHYNSDFSGNVEIVATGNGETKSLLIEGETLVDFFRAAMLEDSHFGNSMRVAIATSIRNE